MLALTMGRARSMRTAVAGNRFIQEIEFEWSLMQKPVP